MPSKGKRVAARQNNLRRRRSTGSRTAGAGVGAMAAPAGDASEPMASAGTATAVANGASAGSPAAGDNRAAAGAAARAVGPPRGRRYDRPAAYSYAGPELIRIGIFSGVLLAALIAVSFVV